MKLASEDLVMFYKYELLTNRLNWETKTVAYCVLYHISTNQKNLPMRNTYSCETRYVATSEKTKKFSVDIYKKHKQK